jgi:hypothetical protein
MRKLESNLSCYCWYVEFENKFIDKNGFRFPLNTSEVID